MITSESIKEITAALVKFQGECPNPKTTEDNAFFKSKYTPLGELISHCKPYLAKNGLAVIQDVKVEDEFVFIITTIYHSSGEFLQSDTMKLKVQDSKGVNLNQAAGISISYGRRYQYSSTLGLSSEADTDGNTAEQQNNPGGGVKSPGKISEGQVKRLFAIAYSKKIPKEKIEEFVAAKYKKKVEELSMDEYKNVCENIEKK